MIGLYHYSTLYVDTSLLGHLEDADKLIAHTSQSGVI